MAYISFHILYGTKVIRCKSFLLYGSFTSKNSDAQLDYNLFVEKFGIKDNVMIIGVNSDNFFDFDNFQHWQSFADNIKSIPGVEEVYSITDAVGLKKSKQEKS